MNKTTPKSAGFAMPAEWAPHKSVWTAWPSHGELWQKNLEPAQAEFVALCRAIHADGAGEALNILVPTDEAAVDAARALAGLGVTLCSIPFGDIWLRDTAPLFLRNSAGESASVSFQFNSWGNKYDLPHDPEVSENIAEAAGHRVFQSDLILEGGSVEVDGEGTCLTTRQCLLNPNRNPGLSEAEIEDQLCDYLGVEKVLWLGDGLLNDHTDGHIDTIARFVAPGEVVCMSQGSADDPNSEILAQIYDDLSRMTDARGRRLKVHTVPSPSQVLSEDGEVMPASYVNFYIGNKTVVVPNYGVENDARATHAIAKLFPNHKTVGSMAHAILTGGGAFHCITQQEV